MQDDPFPAADRILSDIEIVFKKDPELKEFDILHVTLNQNKSPVHHVEHCLGLESWCVRHVYCYTYRRLMNTRQQRHHRTEPATLSRLLLGALLLNPDVPTFWNMRRELVQAGRLDINAELHFAAVVLSRKPKSAEAFSHRKWLLGRLLSATPDMDAILTEELRVSLYAADHYANNYHAWQHRAWCMSRLVPALSDPVEALAGEWTTSEAWISTHVSDHSGLQYRQFLLTRLCHSIQSPTPAVLEPMHKALHHYLREAVPVDGVCSVWNSRLHNDFQTDMDSCPSSYLVLSLCLIASELLLNSDLIVRYTGHEALWCHRRFLLASLKSILRSVWTGNQNSGDGLSELSSSTEKMLQGSTDSGDYKLSSQHSNSLRIQAQEAQRNSSHYNNHNEDLARFCGNDIFQLKENCGNKNDKGVEQKLCVEEEEICRLVFKAAPWHEEQLLAKSDSEDMHQKSMAGRHREWLIHILQLPAQ